MVRIAIVAALGTVATLSGHGRGSPGAARAQSQADEVRAARMASLCRLLAPEADDWKATADACAMRPRPDRLERIVDVWCSSQSAGVAISAYWDDATGEVVRVAVSRKPAIAAGGGRLPRTAAVRVSRWWRDGVARWAGDPDHSPRLVEQDEPQPDLLWTCWKTARGTVALLVDDRDGTLHSATYAATGRPYTGGD